MSDEPNSKRNYWLIAATPVTILLVGSAAAYAHYRNTANSPEATFTPEAARSGDAFATPTPLASPSTATMIMPKNSPSIEPIGTITPAPSITPRSTPKATGIPVPTNAKATPTPATTVPPTATPTAIPTATPTAAPTPVPAVHYSVDITGFAFSSPTLNIHQGDSVTWTNRDSAVHTVTGSGLNSGNLAQGAPYTYTFGTVGPYNYKCAVHPYMTGSVTVN